LTFILRRFTAVKVANATKTSANVTKKSNYFQCVKKQNYAFSINIQTVYFVHCAVIGPDNE